MAEQDKPMDKQEQDQIIQIALDYFKKETGSDKKAQEMLGQLAAIVKEEGSKLVHLGNVLFLIMVRGKGVVEIHTIGTEAQPRMLADDFKKLADYLKNIDVKTAYTYTPDNRYGRLAQMTGLPVKTFKIEVEGKPMTAYVMEF
jgi:hypothetical protein